MPRIRQDNDARYALRASFTDQFGNVLEGDTITIEQPGLGSVFAHYKWSDKEDSTDDKKISINSQSDYTLATKLYISTKTQNDVQAANVMDAYLTENTVVYIQKNKTAERYVAVVITSPTFVEYEKYREYDCVYRAQGTEPLEKDDEVGVVLVNGAGSANDPRISDTQIANWDATYSWYATIGGNVTTNDINNWNTAYSWGNHASAGYASSSSVGGGAQYIDTVRGQYGSVDVDNTTNSWAGYGISGQVVFMNHPGSSEWGIYNDIDNEWYINGYRNDRTDIFYNGGWRIRTTANGMTVNGTISASGYNSSNWDTAYNWGNHASAGYLVEGTTITSGIGSTTSWTAATKFKSAGDISQAAGGHSLSCYSDVGNDAFMSFHVGGDYAIHFGLENATNRLYYGGWSHGTGNKYQLWSTQDFSSTSISQWNAAYNWGNHATQGYTTYNGSDAVKTTYNSSLNSDSRNSRGVTRLYRRDSDSDYSVQHNWTGSHWHLRGYYGDGFHAECRVGYADTAGSANSVAWGNVSGKPTLLGAINYSNNSNSTYQMLWGSGNAVYGTAGIYCNPYSNIIYSSQIVCSDWVRTTGATGWYNNTYGGGFRMTDTTWVRVYGNKQFYNENTSGNSIATPGDVVAGYSDIRLKDVEEVENDALTKIKGWDSIYYRDNEKARELGYEGSERKFGLVAQQVQETLPEVIKRAPIDMDADGGSLSGEDYITVDYERVVPMLVAGIKELTEELESVKLELKELRDGASK